MLFPFLVSFFIMVNCFVGFVGEAFMMYDFMPPSQRALIILSGGIQKHCWLVTLVPWKEVHSRIGMQCLGTVPFCSELLM